MKNGKKVIAIDIDDVLSSQLEVLIEFSNSKLEGQFTVNDFMKPGEYWGYYEYVWDIGREEGRLLFKEFLDEKYPLKQVVKEDVKDALKILKKDYDLEIITSRGNGYEDITTTWINEQIPNMFDGVHFVHEWDLEGRKATKAIICKEIGAEYLIDDNAEHCILASEVGVKSLLFGKYGWNIDKITPPTIKRVNNWLEVLKYFQDEQR